MKKQYQIKMLLNEAQYRAFLDFEAKDGLLTKAGIDTKQIEIFEIAGFPWGKETELLLERAYHLSQGDGAEVTDELIYERLGIEASQGWGLRYFREIFSSYKAAKDVSIR